jgi:2Fe-2S ferredoxin
MEGMGVGFLSFLDDINKKVKSDKYLTEYKDEKGRLIKEKKYDFDDDDKEVALKNDIELHHNCGGVCACSTCHLYVEQGEQFIEELSDKEEDFIDRAVNPRLNSRLGCQCVLNAGSGEIVVTLPDQTQFLGE